jgi:hypothetical protein
MSERRITLDRMAVIQRQWPIIATSWRNATKGIIGESYLKATGLTESDPGELWSFALGKSEPRVDLVTEEVLKRQKQLEEGIEQHEPTHDADKIYEAGRQWMTQLGTPTLRETVQRLAARIEDSAELAGHLSKLLKLYHRPPITRAEYDDARKDSDPKTGFLLRNWIQDPPRENWMKESLCVYSHRAMAKLVHFYSQKEEPRTRLALHQEETEAERIKKIYQRMDLIPAKVRLIRDVKFEHGKVYFAFFQSALLKQ